MAKPSDSGLDQYKIFELTQMGGDELRDESMALVESLCFQQILLETNKNGEMSDCAWSLCEISERVYRYSCDNEDILAFISGRPKYPEGSISIPAEILFPLVIGWFEYVFSKSRKNLGEVFKVDGSGQGKRPAKEFISALHRDFHVTKLVILKRSLAEAQGAPISIEKAISQIVHECDGDISMEMLLRAYKRFSRQLTGAYKSVKLGS